MQEPNTFRKSGGVRERKPASGRQGVYAILCPATGLIKVGRAIDCDARLRELQTGSASTLILLARLSTRPDDENEWHDAMAGARVRGEWFCMTPYLYRALLQQGVDASLLDKSPWSEKEGGVDCRAAVDRFRRDVNRGDELSYLRFRFKMHELAARQIAPKRVGREKPQRNTAARRDADFQKERNFDAAALR